MSWLDFFFVKGHSGDKGNDQADRLADLGARGKQTLQSQRWLSPLNEAPPVKPLHMDHCWRCNRVYSGPSHARQLAGHEAYCKVPGAPPPYILCRNGCGKRFAWQSDDGSKKRVHHAREWRNLHEKICRGSERLTLECPYCQYSFPVGTTDETVLLHRNNCSSCPEDAKSLRRTRTCEKCGANIPIAKCEAHQESCRGSVQANRSCQLCGVSFQSVDARLKHENVCRGSVDANLTCSKCKRVFDSWGSRIAHEKACQGGKA